MRFQCSFCLSLIDTELKFGSRLDCPSCKRKCFVPGSRFSPNGIIGDFVIREKIGGGATGNVYKAVQLSLGREVALKIIDSGITGDERFEALMHEARAAAKLNHVNLIQALAVGEEDGICYMAMNLVEGETVKTRLQREGAFEIDEALHVVQQVAEALWYAWENAHMIHRDVKPENIMITKDGIIKLTDMGLAVFLSGLDGPDVISGSPSYMSPEQFSGDETDSRCDIYSLGITLYEMLSGELPFKSETLEAIAEQHFREVALPLHRLNQDIPVKVSNLVRRMMEKYPEDRFADMNELLNEIWEVRQITAPDNAMVPDVHTISIGRLNYERQLKLMQSEESNTQNVIRSENERRRSRRKDIFYIVTLSIVLLSMIFSHLFQYYLSYNSDSYTDSHEFESLQHRIQNFEDNMNSGHIANSILEIEAIDILKNFPAKRVSQLDPLYWKMRCYIAELREHNLRTGMVSKDNYIKELSLHLNNELLRSSSLEQELADKEKGVEDNQKQQAMVESELRKEIEKLRSMTERFSLEVKNADTRYEQVWKNLFLTALYFSIRNRDFNRAMAIIGYYSGHQPAAYQLWCQSFQKIISELEKIDTLFYSKTSKLVGLTIPREGRIVMVDSGNIFFQSKGTVRSSTWYDLEPAILYSLIRQAAPEINAKKNNLEIVLALYGGNMTHPALNNAQPPILEWRGAVVKFSIESILILSFYNRTQASAESVTLLERFKHIPELATEIEQKLKQLL